MTFTKRQLEILYYINDYTEVTVKQISKQIGVTSQTIKTELTALEQALKEFDITIDFQLGKGISIQGSSHLQKFLAFAESNLEFSIQNQVILLLILNRDFLILQDIADQLFISKSQVEKLMPHLIKKYSGEVTSARHYGYKYIGNELSRRNLFVKLIEPYMTGSNLETSFRDFSKLHFSLENYFSNESIQGASEALHSILNLEKLMFTDQSLQQLFLYLVFILGNPHEVAPMSEEFTLGIKAISDFDTYMIGVEEINKQVTLKLPDSEKDYLCYLFMSLKKQKVLNRNEILKEMNPFVLSVLDKIHDCLSIDLRSDEHLIDGLSSHIYTAILTRAMFNHSSENNMWKDIKKQYPLGYEMATITSNMIIKSHNHPMEDYDRIYLALHFQAAIENMPQVMDQIRTVVVCHFGVAACNLISRKLERLFPEIQVIHMYSLQEFTELDTVDCDLVITTERLSGPYPAMLYVTPVLKEIELKRIETFIKNRNTGLMIETQLSQAHILNIKEALPKETIIDTLITYLEEQGYVDSNYRESVHQREQISSTALPYIAVPHGNPLFVKETKLVIARLAKPILWDDEHVSCIFLLAVTGSLLKENANVFSSFYKTIGNLEFTAHLEALDDKDDPTFQLGLIKLFLDHPKDRP